VDSGRGGRLQAATGATDTPNQLEPDGLSEVITEIHVIKGVVWDIESDSTLSRAIQGEGRVGPGGPRLLALALVLWAPHHLLLLLVVAVIFVVLLLVLLAVTEINSMGGALHIRIWHVRVAVV
jgi:hypothetical protein